MPVVMLVTYLLILGKPGKVLPSDKQVNSSTQEADQPQKGSDDVTVDDSKPLLGEVADDNGGEVDAQVRVGSKWRLRFFNREEAGASNYIMCRIQIFDRKSVFKTMYTVRFSSAKALK